MNLQSAALAVGSSTECDRHGDTLMTVDTALEQMLGDITPVATVEQVRTADALGRVLARDLAAPFDLPSADNSAMDGYALRCADLDSTATRLRVSQRIAAGEVGEPLEPGTAARIFTGAPLPPGADAVVMQEVCERRGDEVLVTSAVAAGENLRRRGYNLRQGERFLRRGDVLRPQDLGLAANLGLAELAVFRRLRVAVLSTGDELVEPGAALAPGKSYNGNNLMLVAIGSALGCKVDDLGIVPDDFDQTCRRLAAAADHDLVITTGGVSVGEEDHVKIALETVGRLELWRIALKPGKPLAYGAIGNARFLGLPGNPVSSFVTFLLIVKPLLRRMQGASHHEPQWMPVRAGFDWPAGKRREYARARLSISDDGLALVEIHPNQNSDVLSSAVWADGLVELPEGRQIRAGDPLRYLAFEGLL